MRYRSLLLCLYLVLFASSTEAHKPSDSYLSLSIDGAHIQGQWDIALRDLDYAIGLDSNDDGAITWGELRAKHKAIEAYALPRLRLQADGAPCASQPTTHMVDAHTDGMYTVLRFLATCPSPPQVVSADYALFFDLDPQHRGLLRLTSQNQTHTGIFSPARHLQHFALATLTAWHQWRAFVRAGVWHIWSGYDHILFLLALLLPAVLRREAGCWQAVGRFGAACSDTAKIVTAFTVAHSMTLSLVTLSVIHLPSRLVEAAIAASVGLAALNNLYPLFPAGRRWLVGFTFGLLHGCGFASVLVDLNLPREALLVSLVGFNLGVEAGQLAIVGIVFPLAYALRRSWFYQRVTLAFGSLVIAMLSSLWLLERLFHLTLLSF